MTKSEEKPRYKVIRISKLKNWFDYVKNFTNKTNSELSNYLNELDEYGKYRAYDEDIKNINAVFLVIDKITNEVAHYFALKTTCIFQVDETRQLFITKKVNNDSKNGESKESKVRVPIACPSIELSMFCNNDNYSQKNKFNSEKYKMGRYFFDEIIMPKIKKLSEQVGFVYLCLYAADQTKKKNREDNIKNETNEKKLVKYYEKLNFKGLSDIQEEINTEFMDEDNDDDNSILIMPPQTDYEVNCCFMCQRLKFD